MWIAWVLLGTTGLHSPSITTEWMRSIITQLRAPMDPQGLVHALDASVEAFLTTRTELEFVNEIPDLRLASEQEAQVFHLVQEALTNIARHAGAQHARLGVATMHAGASPWRPS